jgi:hypothetical protein
MTNPLTQLSDQRLIIATDVRERQAAVEQDLINYPVVL